MYLGFYKGAGEERFAIYNRVQVSCNGSPIFMAELSNPEIDYVAKAAQEKAEKEAQKAALCNSRWLINPLQDFLYLDHKYYLENTQDERINVPGSVNEFNWTYRIPCTIEELKQNQALLNKINEIVKIHDNEKNGGNQ